MNPIILCISLSFILAYAERSPEYAQTQLTHSQKQREENKVEEKLQYLLGLKSLEPEANEIIKEILSAKGAKDTDHGWSLNGVFLKLEDFKKPTGLFSNLSTDTLKLLSNAGRSESIRTLGLIIKPPISGSPEAGRINILTKKEYEDEVLDALNGLTRAQLRYLEAPGPSPMNRDWERKKNEAFKDMLFWKKKLSDTGAPRDLVTKAGNRVQLTSKEGK